MNRACKKLREAEIAQVSLDDESTIEQSLGEPQNFDWNGFNYEFLAEPGVPSA